MMEFFDRGEVGLRYTRDEDGWWMESTPSFEQRFGAVVRVRLPGQPYRGDWQLREVISEHEALAKTNGDKLLAMMKAGTLPLVEH